jgi:hypothetical protein
MGTQTQRGRHVGRGPKGYRRSDERIKEDINEHLTHHPEVDATEIEVDVNQGEVTLRGTVEHRHEKRMAEEVAENVSGVKDVRNELRVQSGQQHGSSGTTGASTGSTGSSGTGATSGTSTSSTVKTK